MSKEEIKYPRISPQARLGDQGVENAGRVFNQFGWLFRRTHQEHDFGIDGYVDVVLEDGSITGQVIAVQIKHGLSFFATKSAHGYIYRGDPKHFNYYCNSSSPLLFVISHPKDGNCYWQVFNPEIVTHHTESWTIEIPFSNKLADSREVIRSLCHPTKDHLGEHLEATQRAEFIRTAGFVTFHIPRTDVKALKTKAIREFFDGLKRTKNLALAAQGKIVICFSGYDSDPRELYDIPEIRAFMPLLDYALPELFFFARTEEPNFTLPVFAACQIPISVEANSPHETIISLEPEYLSAFLIRHWPGLNEMTDWLNLSPEENERIGKAAAASIWPEIWKKNTFKSASS